MLSSLSSRILLVFLFEESPFRAMVIELLRSEGSWVYHISTLNAWWIHEIYKKTTIIHVFWNDSIYLELGMIQQWR